MMADAPAVVVPSEQAVPAEGADPAPAQEPVQGSSRQDGLEHPLLD